MKYVAQISEHALLRYLERIKELDLEAVRKEMLTAEVRAALEAGAARVSIGGMHFLAIDGVVTTVAGGLGCKKPGKAKLKPAILGGRGPQRRSLGRQGF